MVLSGLSSAVFGTQLSIVRSSYYSLSSPTGIVLNKAGDMLIADQNNGRVVVLGSVTGPSPGQGLAAFYGDPAEPLYVPIAVALDDDENIYIADVAGARAVVLSGMSSAAPGTQLGSFPGYYKTWGIGWLDGNIYLTDNGCASAYYPAAGDGLCRVVVLAGIKSSSPAPGTVLFSFEDSNPPLTWPLTGMAFDGSGNIYVATGDDYGTVVVLAAINSAVPGAQVAAFVDSAEQLEFAEFPFLDPRGDVLVSSVGSARVVLLAGLSSSSPPGTELAVFTANNTFANAIGTALDAAGRLYAVDNENARVVVLTGSTLPAPAASGDPLFTGFLGQSYQVHGVHGAVYSILSSARLQLNARFDFLSSGSCPVYGNRSAPTASSCFSHPGSYFGAIGVRTAAGSRLLVLPGAARSGFASIQLDGRELTAAAEEAEASGAALQVEARELSVTLHDRHHASLRHGLFTFHLDSSDRFLNIAAVDTDSWAELVKTVRPHGLLGQSWQRRSGKDRGQQVQDVEGRIDDYAQPDNDLFAAGSLYDRLQTQ